jgi:hypothetical protein
LAAEKTGRNKWNFSIKMCEVLARPESYPGGGLSDFQELEYFPGVTGVPMDKVIISR